MTVDQSWQEEVPFDTDQDPDLPHGWSREKPVHVSFEETQRVAPEFTALTTFSIPVAGEGLAVQICPHRYHRYKAKFLWAIPMDTIVYIAHTPDSLNTPAPNPFSFQVTDEMPDYDGQQPLYAVYTGTGPVSVSVMDESYGPVQ